MNDTLASARAAWPEKAVSPRPHLTSPRGMIAAWRERIRFRWDLKQMAEANPHLIDDIGLTRRQVEAEIVKRFWQV
ncbi:DUF1127 domain-containing protein [Mesorhizobium sp. M0761]|uniref:DUF1127 domain-containing protein n=1 Tax=unclassified Mesorhizobium TaxID=325217 RepID=UPI0003CDE36D|nr:MULTISPECIES: DUF1127 domain-containing protein [unclassified Mesorhizobium]ESW91980.1 hypothetical protein X770_06210 [Mesorhizobium sp. LSJC269B00]ESZ51300.1 hypothetical protein X731_05305 [Mesorhizobium sp. L2C054A000]